MSEIESTISEVLDLNERLLQYIAEGDWAAYEELCDPTITAFEPEARGCRVEGMEFHRFYFDLGAAPRAHNTTICDPHVRLLGDVAVVTYVRLVQRVDDTGKPVTHRGEETRIWSREDGRWRHVHFHRSVGS
jgi:calcium/calmodulin-dependent protein kinase (CaM kinase) II